MYLMPEIILRAKLSVDILDEVYEKEKEAIKEHIPFGKMVYAKLDAIDVKVQPDVIALIFLVTGNPGCIQLILKDILMMDKAKEKIKNHEIVTINDVEDYKYFDFKYEDNEKVVLDELEPKWDAQKDYSGKNFSDNKCDTVEWWMEVYD